jgi:hypothetical protein
MNDTTQQYNVSFSYGTHAANAAEAIDMARARIAEKAGAYITVEREDADGIKVILEEEEKAYGPGPWREVALAEGWDVFEAHRGTTVEFEIERIDEDEKFDSDYEALMYVVGSAAQDKDGPHYEALAYWRANDEASYLKAMDAIREDLP